MATIPGVHQVPEPGLTLERAAVIAIGGNALIQDGERGTIAEQFENARETASQAEERAFHKQLADEASTCRAESGSQGHLASTGGCTREQQIRLLRSEGVR